jgi:hypothetical protein
MRRGFFSTGMKNIPNATILQITAIFLLVTGGYGLLKVLLAFSMNMYGVELIYMVIPIAFFAFTVYAGYRLLKKETNGLKLARTIFALQIINFSAAGIGYYFVTGACFFIAVGTYGGGLHFDISTYMHFYFGTASSGELSFSVNFLAIAAFVLLGRIDKDKKKEEEVKPEDIFPTVKSPMAGRPRETRI